MRVASFRQLLPNRTHKKARRILRCDGLRAAAVSYTHLDVYKRQAIVVGQELGADRLTGARRTAWRMITLSLASCVIMGAALAVCAPFIPRIYNTEEPIRLLATELIRMAALCMPLYGFANCEYFTLRSGGKTFITFLFDSCFTWAVSVPMAYCLSRFSGLNIVTIYLFVNGMDIIKCTIGFVLVKKGVWVKNIVKE